MPKRILFLYRGFPEKIDQLTQSKLDGVYVLPNTVLVGIDLDSVSKSQRTELVKRYALREFEVDQEKFDFIIEKIPSLGARIIDVEFKKAETIPHLKEELNQSIIEQNITNIRQIIQEYRDFGNDIQAVEFSLNGNRIRYTRLAELDVSAPATVLDDIPGVLNLYPVGVLSGVLREDGDLQ